MALRTALFSALGGGLFGLDVGYISGIQEMSSFHAVMNDGLPLEPVTDGAMVALFPVGAILGSCPPIAARLGASLGGKGAIQLGALVFCVGSLLQGSAFGVGQFCVGRLVSGTAVGVLSTFVPLYQAEVAHPARRGALVALYQLAITLGIAAAFWINFGVRDAANGWRISVLAQLCPGLLLAGGMRCMPQSPRWLVGKGRRAEARSELARVRHAGADVGPELVLGWISQQNC